MLDFSKVSRNMHKLSWKSALEVLCLAFIFANVLNIWVGSYLMPSDGQNPTEVGTNAPEMVPYSSLTLNQADVDTIVDRNVFNSFGEVPKENDLENNHFDPRPSHSNLSQAYRNELLKSDFFNPLQEAKLSTYLVDGELKGFTLTQIGQDSVYEKAGFQNEDIVEEIDGIPLQDTSQVIRLLQSLKNGSALEVGIIRGGAPRRFTINIGR